ncbi:MAG: FGGY-family carbohydrate kinase [Hyphomicrobiales bacterium]|nr:FGGY-family carbohydrate kinase [Hyphomicrobiales bacterium]
MDPHVPLFVGIDVGSASVRAGLYDPTGRRLAFRVRPILQFHPRADFVEQSSADIWANATAAVAEAIAAAGVDPARVAAIGVDATCSLVAVAADGSPVSVAEDGDPARDVVMWMDHRAGREAEAIDATGDPALAYVGGKVSIEMELPKLLWLKRRFPERWAQAARFRDLADFLVWRATGADVASVCTLGCKWNWLAHEGRFPEAMLAAVGLDDLTDKVAAEVKPLGTVAGHLDGRAAAEMGLPAGIPVATGIIDAHAGGLALVGAAPVGALALIGGTSNCHMVASPGPVMVPGVWGPYFGAMIPGLWLNEGGQSAAGALIDWTLRRSTAFADLTAEAGRRGCDVYALLADRVAALEEREDEPTRHLHVLPDHHGNRSPRADPDARGAIVGLTLEPEETALPRLHLATLQALAYGTRHIVETMNAAGHRIERLVMCGGGTKSALLLREHADALGRPIHLVEDEDAVTLGAALLAAVASGAFADVAAAAGAMVRPGATIEPNPARRAFHDAKYRVFLTLGDQQKAARDAMAAV